MPVYIYALTDPRDGEIRYVGQTTDPKERYANHWCERRQRTHKGSWLTGLESAGQKPNLLVLEVVAEDSWNDAERWWVQYLRREGCRLTNLTDGDEGIMGFKISKPRTVSPEVRAKISATLTGRKLGPHSEEHRRKIGDAQRGRKLSPERCEKNRLWHLGRKRSAASCLKQGATIRAKGSHRAKLSDMDAITIRQRLAQGSRGAQLAAEYGVTQSAISAIKVRRSFVGVEERVDAGLPRCHAQP